MVAGMSKEDGRLRRITERPVEEEEQEEEEDEEVEGRDEGADLSSVTVEAWTSFNRLHTVNNLACLAWAQVH